MTSLQEKTCLECLAPLKGRADKKFCCDLCRTAHNNRLNSRRNNYMKNVNNILRRNRRILTELNAEGRKRVSIEKLKARGFNFNYYTNKSRTRAGGEYYYCYEHGYMPMEKDHCLLVVKKTS
ncbi:MAG TPA: hypothetical protein VEB86_01585 [Chryseosolibacter sp.]|nr:hypothetical protein [Chryseosolibacter sp.]